jgi:hypothetical protein
MFKKKAQDAAIQHARSSCTTMKPFTFTNLCRPMLSQPATPTDPLGGTQHDDVPVFSPMEGAELPKGTTKSRTDGGAGGKRKGPAASHGSSGSAGTARTPVTSSAPGSAGFSRSAGHRAPVFGALGRADIPGLTDAYANRATLNDICPNVSLTSLLDQEDLESAEAQQKRLFVLASAACCISSGHFLAATSDDDALLGSFYQAKRGMTPPYVHDASFDRLATPSQKTGGGAGPHKMGHHRTHSRTHSYSASYGLLSASHADRSQIAHENAAREALDTMLRASLPPNHAIQLCICSDETTRDDLAAVLQKGQDQCPAKAFVTLATQRAPMHRRSRSSLHSGGIAAVTGGGTTAVNMNATSRGHTRTTSLQSTDSGQSPELMVEPDSFIDAGVGMTEFKSGTPLDETLDPPYGSGLGAVGPRMSRRTSSGGPAAIVAPAAAGAVLGGLNATNRNAIARAGRDTFGVFGSRNTTTLGAIVVLVGLHRLAADVADALATFLTTGTLPPTSASEHSTSYSGVTVVALTNERLVPQLSLRLRAGFVLSSKLSIGRLQHLVIGARAAAAAAGASSRATGSERSTPNSLNPHGYGTGAGGSWATIGAVVSSNDKLVNLINHDLFVVCCIAKITARPEEAIPFGSAMRRCFVSGENGNVVATGAGALVAAKCRSPGIDYLVSTGRVYCHTSIERYMRHHVAMLRAMVGPQSVMLESMALTHETQLAAVLAASALLSIISMDPVPKGGEYAAESRAVVAGPSIEAAFELLSRAAVPPVSVSDPAHIDRRYVPPERERGYAGRRVERALVTADDVLCLIPHLAAHHLSIGVRLLDASSLSSLTVRFGGSNSVMASSSAQNAAGGQIHRQSSIPQQLNSPTQSSLSAFAGGGGSLTTGPSALAFQAALGNYASQPLTSVSTGLGPPGASTSSPAPITAFEWESACVENAARVGRAFAFRSLAPVASGGVASPMLLLHGADGGGRGHSRHGSDLAAAGGTMDNLLLSEYPPMSMRDQLHVQDSNADYSSLARKRSFNTHQFSDSNFDLQVALAATNRAAMPFEHSHRAHGRTASGFSVSVDDADSSSRRELDSPQRSFEIPSPQSPRVPWPGQLEVEQLASYSRCWDAIRSRLLDHQSVMRPPA